MFVILYFRISTVRRSCENYWNLYFSHQTVYARVKRWILPHTDRTKENQEEVFELEALDYKSTERELSTRCRKWSKIKFNVLEFVYFLSNRHKASVDNCDNSCLRTKITKTCNGRPPDTRAYSSYMKLFKIRDKRTRPILRMQRKERDCMSCFWEQSSNLLLALGWY